MEKRRAIYPGSFDPVTFGHLDIIKRARQIFDSVHIFVAVNADKQPLFTIDERVAFIRKAVRKMPGVSVEAMDGLTVHYALKSKAATIIRGLRATSDFDYEFQMALTNRTLSRKVDTLFLMPSESHFYISSRLIKEIAMLKGDISNFVPPYVAEQIYKRLRQKQ